jgi:hypothetical protein
MPAEREAPTFRSGERPFASDLNQLGETLTSMMRRLPPSASGLARRPRITDCLVKITGPVSGGGGLYTGKIGREGGVLNTSGNAALPVVYPDNDDCVILDVPELGQTTHRMSADLEINGFLAPFYADNGLPVVIVNFGRKTWRVRWNPQNFSLEESDNSEDANPTWTIIVTFAPCEPDPPAVTAAIGGGFVPAFSITAPISSTRTLAGYLAR